MNRMWSASMFNNAMDLTGNKDRSLPLSRPEGSVGACSSSRNRYVLHKSAFLEN